MLRFIYTDEVEEGAMEAMADHLLVAAMKYQLGRLQVMSEMHLSKTLAVSVNCCNCDAAISSHTLPVCCAQVANAAERLLLAETNSADELKEEAMRFIASNLSGVSQTGGYEKLREQPDLLMELMGVVGGLPDASRGKKRAREEEAEGSGGEGGGGLTPQAVRGMKVGQLRAELSKRGLDVAGVRQVLMQRLETAVST